MGKVVSREATNGIGTSGENQNGWIRYAVSVQAVYKKGKDSKLRKGTTIMHVSTADLACKCPKIKTNKYATLTIFLGTNP